MVRQSRPSSSLPATFAQRVQESTSAVSRSKAIALNFIDAVDSCIVSSRVRAAAFPPVSWPQRKAALRERTPAATYLAPHGRDECAKLLVSARQYEQLATSLERKRGSVVGLRSSRWLAPLPNPV